MTRYIKSLTLALLALVAAPSGIAFAQSKTTAADDSIKTNQNLEELVVTGTRTAKTLKDTPIQTRVISELDLKRDDATNIQDLLQQELPGVEFTYAMNQQVNMNIGGFSGKNVLILLDGERLSGETMENTDFSRLSMNSVKRVEIIRGAASVLYGSNASGGVINIITKEADEPWKLNLNVRGADHGEWRFGATSLVKVGKVSNTLDVNYHRIGTYTVCLNTSAQCDFRTVFGQRLWNFRDRISYRPLENLTFTGRAGYYFKQRYYNVDTPDRYRAFSGGLRGDWDITSRDRLEVSYNFDQYDKSEFIRQNNLDLRDYSNVQNSIRALYNHTLREKDVLSVGADYMRDYLLTYQFIPGETHVQNSTDIFAQYDWNINKQWEVIGAARWDYFTDGESHSQLTGKLSARYMNGGFTLRGGYAGGFRAPSLKEKYMYYNMQDIFDIHGNPDLKSEKSHNLNLSAEYNWKYYYFMLGANYNFISQRITTSGVRYGPDVEMRPYIEYINVENMRVFGLDAQVRGSWPCGVSAEINYNYTHEKSPGATVNQFCPARPHSLTFKGTWTHEWIKNYPTQLILNGRFLSKVSYISMYMFEPFEERVIENPAYTMWKIQLSQKVYKGITLNIAVDNLFNYAPKVYAFNSPVSLGANLMIGVNIDVEQIFKK